MRENQFNFDVMILDKWFNTHILIKKSTNLQIKSQY